MSKSHHFTRGKKTSSTGTRQIGGWVSWSTILNALADVKIFVLDGNRTLTRSSVHFSELEKEHPFLQEMAQVRHVVSSYEMFIHKVTDKAGGVILQNFIFGHFLAVYLLRLIPGI
jgi:hypothetical protein